jgi:hypothetical protein
MILNFRDAFTCAFFCARRQLVWTNDPVLKTSAMQSSIYPAIGRYNVLITYVIGSVTAQVAWANHTFASILVLLGNGARSFL